MVSARWSSLKRTRTFGRRGASAAGAFPGRMAVNPMATRTTPAAAWAGNLCVVMGGSPSTWGARNVQGTRIESHHREAIITDTEGSLLLRGFGPHHLRREGEEP